MSYTRNITMWGSISKLTQFDILIGQHKQSHHSDYNGVVRKQHIMHKARFTTHNKQHNKRLSLF